jgi:hypothetical protein
MYIQIYFEVTLDCVIKIFYCVSSVCYGHIPATEGNEMKLFNFVF